MDALKEVLAAVVEQASFDLETTEISVGGRHLHPSRQRVSASELREIYLREIVRTVELSVTPDAPEESISRLEDTLRCTLGRFIDHDTDQIGHAFPIRGGYAGNRSSESSSRTTYGPDGLRHGEFSSPLSHFANALVRATALIGVEKAAGLLDEWKRGVPLELCMCTVLNGLPLAVPARPREDIRLDPLALTTSDLPRLPIRGDAGPRDYLGLTLLMVRLTASPALFRPNPDGKEQTVWSCSVEGINLDTVCESLSLQTGRNVSKSFMWHDYADATAFRLDNPNTWSEGGDRLSPMAWKKVQTNVQTGAETITPSDDEAPQCVDDGELRRIIEALPLADKKLRIAVDRWRRSKFPGARLEDRLIDLRIALEALYLKDFTNENSQEMRFRLALMGAWHLSESLEERRTYRKVLRDAYDRASGAVHTGEVPRDAEVDLALAQQLCRRGILKLLLEGAPSDWGDLILGAEDIQKGEKD